MKTITINLYTFDEIGPEAQAKALKENTDMLVTDPYWDTPTLESWKDRLAELGYINPDISYTGFSSQGDGASFECEDIKHESPKELAGIEYTIEITRINNHHAHPNTVSVNVEPTDSWLELTEEQKNAMAKLEQDTQEEARKLMREIYKDLENEYEFLQSEAVIKEFLQENEYTFEADGTLHLE